MRGWLAGLWQAFSKSYDTDEMASSSTPRGTGIVVAAGVVIFLAAGYAPAVASVVQLEHAWLSALSMIIGGLFTVMGYKHGCRGTWGTLGCLLDNCWYTGAFAWASVSSTKGAGFMFAAVLGLVLVAFQGAAYALSWLIALSVGLPIVGTILFARPDPIVGLALVTAYVVALLRMEITREQGRRGLRPRATALTSSTGQRYLLGSVLGAGGMGVVYRGVDAKGKDVAIKRLHPYWLDDPQQHKRLLREALIVNEIHHTAIVPILDHGEVEGLGPFLVMDLLHGQTLKKRVEAAGGSLPWPEVVHAATVLLDGLAAGHAKGIVHCDVKPSNVFLCDDGQVKLLDFGIARPPALMVDTTLSVHIAGTPACMAPEQVFDPASIDARTDLWALGATLFWALSGEWPRALPEPLDSLEEAARLPARPIQTLLADLPAEVAKAIDTALRSAPGERWGSAGEMRRCLVSFSSDEFDTQSTAKPFVGKHPRVETTQEGA